MMSYLKDVESRKEISEATNKTSVLMLRIKHAKETICYRCKKRGHLTTECESRVPAQKIMGSYLPTDKVLSSDCGRGNPKFKISGDKLAYAVNEVISNAENDWLIDPGSFTHICCEEKYFLELDILAILFMERFMVI